MQNRLILEKLNSKPLQLVYELLLYLVFFLDLASCNYFLLPNLKKSLGGKRYSFNEKVLTKPNIYFVSFEKSYNLEKLIKNRENARVDVLH